jgi:hypothetical protein
MDNYANFFSYPVSLVPSAETFILELLSISLFSLNFINSLELKIYLKS